MGLRWSTPPRTAWGDLSAAYVLAIRQGVRAIAQRRAPEIEAWMKSNASWTDRTGNARQTLSAEVEEATHDMVTILLAHGVEYGIFLELAHGGAYAVIAPAVDVWGPILWADVRALLR